MIAVVLYQPEIPPNTGNVIRLCANAGAELHLVRPLGFSLDDRRLRRAGLDYHEYARLQVHDSLDAFLSSRPQTRLLAISTRGRQPYHRHAFEPRDALLFGPETRGLPQALLDSLPAAQTLHIPMRPGNRSLNLSNSVAVTVYEAWRQQAFAGAVN